MLANLNKIKQKLSLMHSKLAFTTDLHSHLIPEIDDGCNSMQLSIDLIKQMKKLGYTKLIITPHIMSHRYPNTNKIIKQGLFELRGMLRVENIDIEIEASAEYYCDEIFLELIKKRDLLSFGDKYVLFEMSYKIRPNNLEVIIENLISYGYKPVLAHPERYLFLNEILDFRKLKKLGVMFQVNINSIGGYYGKEAQKKSLMLSQKGMVDFIGSDLHNQKHMDHYKENIFSNNIEILLRNNKILNDKI